MTSDTVSVTTPPSSDNRSFPKFLTDEETLEQPWPHDLNYLAFCQRFPLEEHNLYTAMFRFFADRLRVKRERIGAFNLRTIVESTFKLSRQSSFDAMTLRDLSADSGISMGGIYNYINSKEELGWMIAEYMRQLLTGTLWSIVHNEPDTLKRLELCIRLSIYMAERFQPWYWFVYMEGKGNSGDNADDKSPKRLSRHLDEQAINELLALITEGEKEGIYSPVNSAHGATMINAILQNWFMKHWWFLEQGTSVDDYADYAVALIKRLLLTPKFSNT